MHAAGPSASRMRATAVSIADCDGAGMPAIVPGYRGSSQSGFGSSLNASRSASPHPLRIIWK